MEDDRRSRSGFGLPPMVPVRTPVGFGFGAPDTSPDTGFVDPILLNREGHLLTVAPTGAGKGVGCIIPALLHYDGPAIVIDPKGENAAITTRRRSEGGGAGPRQSFVTRRDRGAGPPRPRARRTRT